MSTGGHAKPFQRFANQIVFKNDVVGIAFHGTCFGAVTHVPPVG